MFGNLSPGLLAWVAGVTGQPVTAARRMDRWRPTWFVDVGSGGVRRTVLLKTPRAPAQVVARSAMLRSYGLDREGDALEALAGTGVPVPELVGRRPGEALLLGVVPGTGQVTTLPPAQRRRAMREYGGLLGALHGLDASAPAVARLAAPTSAPTSAPWRPGPLGPIVEDWVSVRHLLRPEPLIDLGLHWLRATRPAAAGPCLLHGDAGPDQFMVHDGHVAAVLDWELAHVGDPSSDLGYARFRESLYPTAAYGDLLDGYCAAGATAGPPEVVGWYAAVAALVMLVGINRGVQRPRATNPEAAQRLWWDALARLSLCQVLAEHAGRPVPVPSPGDGHGGPHPAAAPVRDLLAQYTGGGPVPAGDPHATVAALEAALARLEATGSHGGSATGGSTPHVAGPEELDRLTADAAAGVWALAPLAVLDSWTGNDTKKGSAEAAWAQRLVGPVLPAVARPAPTPASVTP